MGGIWSLTGCSDRMQRCTGVGVFFPLRWKTNQANCLSNAFEFEASPDSKTLFMRHDFTLIIFFSQSAEICTCLTGLGSTLWGCWIVELWSLFLLDDLWIFAASHRISLLEMNEEIFFFFLPLWKCLSEHRLMTLWNINLFCLGPSALEHAVGSEAKWICFFSITSNYL